MMVTKVAGLKAFEQLITAGDGLNGVLCAGLWVLDHDLHRAMLRKELPAVKSYW
jgi:hypothetical protein